MKSLSIKRRLVAGAVLGVCALVGAIGTAQAAPLLEIQVLPATTDNHQEVIGDAGGTSFASGPASVSGPGLPTINGGWADSTTFGTEAGIGRGMTGFHAGQLNLSKEANVTFQYMGKGDASLVSRFYVDSDNNGFAASDLLFTGGTTPACVGGASPTCIVGTNQFTFHFAAGLIPFRFMTGNFTVDNTFASNGDVTGGIQPEGFFLGVDPYSAAGAFQKTGSAVYAGLTDKAATGDHDFQDLGVRISTVPEPGSLALLGLAMGGLAFMRRRQKAV